MSVPDYRVYVLSLPRSGSSMMTGILEELGRPIVYTSEDEVRTAQREAQEQKRYGDEYRMNPSFKEIVSNQFENWMRIYNTPGSGCKVIIPVTGFRWDAIKSRPAKCIMMWRDPEEIRQSQEAAYSKPRAPIDGDDPAATAEAWLRTALTGTQTQLERRAWRSNRCRFDGAEPGSPNWIEPFDYIVVKYQDVIDDPLKRVAEVARFIDAGPGAVNHAAGTVDAKLKRFNKAELEQGI